MSNTTKDSSGQKPFRVRRGSVDSVDLYEIKDSELDLLEKGTPAHLQLNFAIFLLSIAFSSIGTLVTATFVYPIVQNIFLVTSVIGTLLGMYLLLGWYQSRSSLKELCKEIRRRLPTDEPSHSHDAAHETQPVDRD